MQSAPVPSEKTQTETSENWLAYYRRSPRKTKAFLMASALLSAVVTCGSLFLSWKILTINAKNEEKIAVAHPPPVPKEEPVPEYMYGFEMRDLSVPIADKLGVRSAYAQFTIMFDCPTKDARDQMGLHRARIMDSIYEAAAHVTIEDLATEAGFRTFKMHLKELLENRLDKIAPRDFAVKNWFVR